MTAKSTHPTHARNTNAIPRNTRSTSARRTPTSRSTMGPSSESGTTTQAGRARRGSSRPGGRQESSRIKAGALELLRECGEALVKASLLRGGEGDAAFPQAPARESVDPSCEREQRRIDEQIDGVVGVDVVGPCDGQIDEDPKAGMRGRGRRERGFQEAGRGRVVEQQQRLARVPRETGGVPEAEQTF